MCSVPLALEAVLGECAVRSRNFSPACSLLLLGAVLVLPPPASAAWLPNGTRVGPLLLPTDDPPDVGNDGAGGAFFAWEEYLSRTTRLTSAGEYAHGWSESGMYLGIG